MERVTSIMEEHTSTPCKCMLDLLGEEYLVWVEEQAQIKREK